MNLPEDEIHWIRLNLSHYINLCELILRFNVQQKMFFVLSHLSKNIISPNFYAMNKIRKTNTVDFRPRLLPLCLYKEISQSLVLNLYMYTK